MAIVGRTPRYLQNLDSNESTWTVAGLQLYQPLCFVLYPVPLRLLHLSPSTGMLFYVQDDRKANHDSGSVSSSANRREVSNPMAEPSPAKQPRLDQDVVTDGTSSTHSSRARQTVADRDASSRRGVTSVRRDSIHPTGSANQPTDIYEQDDSVLDEVSRMSSLINCDCC